MHEQVFPTLLQLQCQKDELEKKLQEKDVDTAIIGELEATTHKVNTY